MLLEFCSQTLQDVLCAAALQVEHDVNVMSLNESSENTGVI